MIADRNLRMRIPVILLAILLASLATMPVSSQDPSFRPGSFGPVDFGQPAEGPSESQEINEVPPAPRYPIAGSSYGLSRRELVASNRRYADYTSDRSTDDRSVGNRYDANSNDQYAQDQYATDQYGGNQSGAGQYGAGQYGAGQYGPGQYGGTQYTRDGNGRESGEYYQESTLPPDSIQRYEEVNPLTSWFDSMSDEEKKKVSWSLPGGWTIMPFGRVRGEMIYAQSRTLADAVIFFNAPNSLGVDDDAFTIHAKTSMLNFALAGPQVGNFQTGGAILINFLGPQPIRNQSGFNVVNAYGELKNDEWRFAAGRMVDLFSPLNPNTINAGQQRGAGNVGIFRGGFGFDRYVQTYDDVKWTLSGRLTQNTVNDFLIVPTSRGTDNGIPNFEGRVGLELGEEWNGARPVSIGLSALWGETRAFDPAFFNFQSGELTLIGALQNVSTTTGFNIDFQFRGENFGVNGEFWMAQAAGTYFVGALQTLNSSSGQGIRSIGGWIEGYYQPNQCVTINIGAGIDDPRNQDVGFITNALNDSGQRTYNSVIWSNVIYDVTSSLQMGFELSYRDTHYLNPNSSSSGFTTHFMSSLSF